MNSLALIVLRLIPACEGDRRDGATSDFVLLGGEPPLLPSEPELTLFLRSALERRQAPPNKRVSPRDLQNAQRIFARHLLQLAGINGDTGFPLGALRGDRLDFCSEGAVRWAKA